ncbi:PKD domain-containing protein [Draconibacterium sp. IB214405]|uniref:PKD domain-containing protein n=1 Tax=Draconibacterium sp. IB214405 TaxID=3097352 RepID=UPI002A180102|nr:PKD domain-containing protein [Draconibacterium sp. IB214405]MDX8339541.1 PKD domain-containing protein [Draconibacterium sp. IB214405]
MKHSHIYLIFFTLCIINSYGQTRTFDFLGENGFNQEPMLVDSVHIINNSNSTDTLVTGNFFSILITAIDELEQNQNQKITAFPNPFDNTVHIIFHSELYERALIKVFSVDGRKIIERTNFIRPGDNKLLLKSNVKGVLFLTITSPNLHLFSKIICNNTSEFPELKLFGNSDTQFLNRELKSAKNSYNTFEYSLGDSLTYTGYAKEIVSDAIHDKPNGDKTYTFIFDVTDSLPHANFEVSAQNVNQGSSIDFFDLSTNNPTDWTWDFGDGESSTIQNPSHTYLTPGTYTVTLIAENIYGTDTIVKQDLIIINTLNPVAAFTANTTTINQGDEVYFSDQSGNSPTSWKWEFGDGETSTIQNPSHTYITTGIYTVKLVVSNGFGIDSLMKQNYITVNSFLPIADFTVNKTVIDEGEEVVFSDLSTNSPLSWKWEFGDGETSTIQNPSHIYSTAGIYSVKLTATNNFGSDSNVKYDFIEVLSNTTPILSVSPTSLDFDTVSTQKYISINNIGGGILSWSCSEEISWLTISTPNGETTSESDQVAITVNRTDLSTGNYSGSITVTSNGGNVEIGISMEVNSTQQVDEPKPPGWTN